MRTLLLLLLLSLPVLAQRPNLKVDLGTTPRADVVRAQERVDLRYHGLTTLNLAYTAPASVTSQQTIRTIQVPPGRIYYIEKITMQANKPVQVQIGTDVDAVFNEPGFFQTMTIGPWDTTIEPKLKLQGGTSAAITLLSVAGIDANDVKITGGYTGYETVQDSHFGADKQILFIGDSQTAGQSLGPTLKSYTRADIWTFKVLDYYREKGESVRPVIDAIIGSTTTHIENRRQAGWLDKGLKPSLIVYMAGVNNTLSTGSTPAGYNSAQAHYEAFIDWKKKQHPNSVLLMISPAPVLNVAREVDVAALRSLMQNAVTAAGGAGAKIYYANGGTAFTATDAANYNDGLHHNALGSSRLFLNAIKPVLDASIPKLP